jgi:hypothetical protein
MSNGLAAFVPEVPEVPEAPEYERSQLSNECKTGITSIICQFSSDNDLKSVDTPTLASVLAKLVDCSGATSLSNPDSTLIFMAQAEIERVLLVRAANVIGRHSLLPEFRLDRLSSNTVGHE